MFIVANSRRDEITKKIGGEDVRLAHGRRSCLVEYFESCLRQSILDKGHTPDDPYIVMGGQRLENLHAFMSTFPNLLESKAYLPPQLLGKNPRFDCSYRFPCQDHSYYWRIKGRRGPVLCTTFPYEDSHVFGKVDDLEDDRRLEMIAYAEANGFAVEVAPLDLPNFYYPGFAVPIAWSQRGVDWRRLATGAMESPRPGRAQRRGSGQAIT